MITEDYVSFETAKLLKEKGFDAHLHVYYSNEGLVQWMTGKKWIQNKDLTSTACIRPTLQMAVKWLRDVHNLIISVKFTIHGWLCDITKIFRDSNGFIVNINHGIGDDSLSYCDEYEESFETAIKYCLENLI